MISSIRLSILMGTFSFLWLHVSDCSGVETLDNDIKMQLEAIKAYSAGNPAAIKAPKEAAAAMQNTLSELTTSVYKVGVESDGKPSAERMQFIKRFSMLIAPYNDALVKIGFISTDSLTGDSDLYALSRQCLSMLEHTYSDDKLANALRTHASGLTSDAEAAYRLLFQHRSLNPSDRAALSRKVLAETDTETRHRWAVHCGKMNIPEVVPVLCEMLSVPFTLDGTTGSTGVFGENRAIANYREVVEVINVLGPAASAALPLLRQRLQELDAALPLEQKRIYTTQLQHAIEQIEGNKPLFRPTAVNGSGPLIETSQPHGLMRTDGNRSSTDLPLSKDTADFLTAPPPGSGKASSPLILWFALVGGITVLVATFFLLLRRRR